MQYEKDDKPPYHTLTSSAISNRGVFGAAYVLSKISGPFIEPGCCGLNFAVNVHRIRAGVPASSADYTRSRSSTEL